MSLLISIVTENELFLLHTWCVRCCDCCIQNKHKETQISYKIRKQRQTIFAFH